MAGKYTKEQFWKLYRNLPQELQDALFSEETGDNIYDICKRNEVEENLGEIVDYVGQVLIGILPPEEFQNTLEKELKLKKEVAKEIFHEINRFIFFPVKENLAVLYKIEIAPSEKPAETPPLKEAPLEEELKKKDIYREPIE